jgi:hypothetical protein
MDNIRLSVYPATKCAAYSSEPVPVLSAVLCVQTGSGAHPASCPMGTGGPFPGGKARPGRDTDHSPPI